SRDGTTTVPGGRATFRIALGHPPAHAPADRRAGDEPAGHPIEQAHVLVFRFAAHAAAGSAMAFLERHVAPGLVVIDGPDPAAWRRVDHVGALRWPEDRPARALLFLHGTF